MSYNFKCNFMQCNTEYIGHTRISLKKTLKQSLLQGQHTKALPTKSQSKITKKELYNNTKIMRHENE